MSLLYIIVLETTVNSEAYLNKSIIGLGFIILNQQRFPIRTLLKFQFMQNSNFLGLDLDRFHCN